MKKKGKKYRYLCINKHAMNKAYDTNRGLMCPTCYVKHSDRQSKVKTVLAI
jgi:hypothetical protein